jgi:asparagine synthase (glutamine-hydrolysing)
MCGIAGIISSPNAGAGALAERLARMAAAMKHRGPDEDGIYISPDNTAGLANTRLAIRDLSPAAHMPMAGHGPGREVWITYNGEIYNAGELRAELERRGCRFRSSSDTEVVLQGYEVWGAEVVERLRGMFAFAIVDRRRSPACTTLFLARDRLGIKPLYYARTGTTFLFASELNALFASGLLSREISPAGLAGYLMLGSVPCPLTIYTGVQSLEPGCTLTLEMNCEGTIQTAGRYWTTNDRRTTIDESTHYALRTTHYALVKQVRCLLEEAVRSHLISDVPLGAFLSGGLDSSAIVALMSKAAGGPIRTCSMVFEEVEYSEAPYARAMAQAVGAKHYERVVTAQDVLREMDGIFRAMDQPTADGVNTYFVSQTARQAGLTVALSGLGGDELFGGYPNTFQGIPQVLRAVKQAQSVPGGTALARSAINLMPTRRRWAKLQDALDRPASFASAYLARRGLFSPSEVRTLLAPDVWHETEREFGEMGHESPDFSFLISDSLSLDRTGDLFNRTSRAELSSYMRNQLLRDTDVMSMAHSLEVRVPFLDHPLVEAVLRLPSTAKVNGHGPKSLLVEAMGNDLPQAIRERHGKQGFVFPFDRWLRGPLGKYRGERADGLDGLLRKDKVDEVWRAYNAGKVHWSRPWSLAALQGWARQVLDDR